jgi:hypothetical protein
MLIKTTYMALRSKDGAYMVKVSFIDGQFPNYRRVIPEDNLIGDEKLKIVQVGAGQVEDALREFKKSPLYHYSKDVPWKVWFRIASPTGLILEMQEDEWRCSKRTPATITKNVEIRTQEEPVTELMNGLHLEHACASIRGAMQFEWEAEGKTWQIKPLVLEKGLSKLLFVIVPLNKYY